MNHNDYPNLDILFGNDNDRSRETIDNLDFKALSIVRQKALEELTHQDHTAIGFVRQHDLEYDLLYAIENLDHLKLYLTIEYGQYNIRGYQLGLIKAIRSPEELIREALINWKLKMKLMAFSEVS